MLICYYWIRYAWIFFAYLQYCSNQHGLSQQRHSSDFKGMLAANGFWVFLGKVTFQEIKGCISVWSRWGRTNTWNINPRNRSERRIDWAHWDSSFGCIHREIVSAMRSLKRVLFRSSFLVLHYSSFEKWKNTNQ